MATTGKGQSLKGKSPLTRVSSTVIVPVRTLKHLRTGIYYIVLGIKRDKQWELKTLPRTAISNIRHIPELASYGVDVDSENARDVMRWLSDMIRINHDRIPQTLLIDHLGFINEGRDGFMHGQNHIPANQDNPKVQFEPGESGDIGLTSAYQPRGSLMGWRMGAELLTPYPVAMLVIIASFTAPLLTILDGQCPSFTVSLAGRTSTGKTSSLKGGGSVWGHPERLIHTWDNTRVALERRLGLYKNLPLFLDDTKLAKTDEIIRDTMYMVQQEQGKGRGTPGGLANPESWRTVVVSTGESSLGSFFTDGGAQARYFEVHAPPFGCESNTTATAVKEVQRIFADNHGHAGPAFIQSVFEMKHVSGWERLRIRHLQLQNDFAKQAKGGAGDRVAGYAAALQVASEAAVHAELLPEDYLKVIPTLWAGVARQASEAPVEERALASLMEWMQGHREHFWGRHRKIGEEPIVPSNGFVGAWSEKLSWKDVSFFRNTLETILEDLGFRHPDGVIRGWKDRGYLITDKDANRLDRNTSFRSEPARMVTVRRSAFDKVQGTVAERGGEEDFYLSGRLSV